jgi:uncharacterized membrane protein
MKKDHHLVSVLKGITWRIVGKLDTMMLSYLFTGSVGSALKIGATEIFTKVCLFYFHERVWLLIKWGLKRKPGLANETEEAYEESHIRSVIKGVSWRVVGTIDTIIIASFWTGDYSKAMKIGITEVVTKIGLYYFHERIWMHFMRKSAIQQSNAELENNISN